MSQYEILKQKITESFDGYNNLYKPFLCESENIETYGTNEFFGGKREAYEDMLDFINRMEKPKN